MAGPGLERVFTGIGGLTGAAGIGLLALAAHGRWPTIDYAAIMALVHACALVALAAAIRAGVVHRTLAGLAGAAMVVAVALFAGDVTLNALTGGHLFAMAAPSGGSLSIAAWVVLALAGLCAPARP